MALRDSMYQEKEEEGLQISKIMLMPQFKDTRNTIKKPEKDKLKQPIAAMST